MRIPWFPVLVPLALASPALAGGDALPDRSPAPDVRPQLRAVTVDPTFDLAPDATADGSISNILYVNRCADDCQLQPGTNDARYDRSSIIPGAATLTEFNHPQEVWDLTIECLREVYGPYDVEIVTEDPGDVFHHEAMLAGHPTDLGFDSMTGGIAPASCQPLNNVISFSFANFYSDDTPLDEPLYVKLCWTVAQESAHAFGLKDHVFDCSDPMTYIRGCGQKFFRDKGLPCGELSLGDRPCSCGSPTQNSHQLLLAVFGEGTVPSPPEVEFLYPADGAEVADNFSIFVDSWDPRLVDRLELWLNGSRYDGQPGHGFSSRQNDYQFVAPDLPDGYIDIEVRSFNDLDRMGSATITVLKGAPCSGDQQCFAGQTCAEGYCRFPPPDRAMGDACERTSQCLEGTCKAFEGERRCVADCDLSVADSCGDGQTCVGSGFCWDPSGDSGGCGCGAIDSSDGRAGMALLACLLVLALVRRRLAAPALARK